jgi:hypothetical protein
MKTTKAIIVFIIAFFLFYLGLSATGCLFRDQNLNHFTYSACVGNITWFMMYTLFIGWWLAGIPATEYYETQK